MTKKETKAMEIVLSNVLTAKHVYLGRARAAHEQHKSFNEQQEAQWNVMEAGILQTLCTEMGVEDLYNEVDYKASVKASTYLAREGIM